jgi:hypothetical protein
MDNTSIFVFTHIGLGGAPAELQQKLAVKFLQLDFDANGNISLGELPFRLNYWQI